MVVTDERIAAAYLRRGAMLWLLARMLISTMIVLAGGDPLVLPARPAIVVILVSTMLGLVQTARLREGLLLGNLGVSRVELTLYLALPALAGELIVTVAHALLT